MKPKKIVTILGALAHENRLAIYRALVESGPLSAGVIAEQLGVPPSSLTFHTQILVRAGLATRSRVSRQLIYAADTEKVTDIIDYLTKSFRSPTSDPASIGISEKQRKAAKRRQDKKKPA